MLEIVERYLAISGEAPVQGAPVYIVRFSGCNLDCAYCDTAYNTEKNEELTVEALTEIIAGQLRDYSGLGVLFTGGEPLLAGRGRDLLEVINAIPGTHFYIETNGSIPVSAEAPANCHYVADIKAPSSGEADSFHAGNIDLLRPERDCIKFVVGRDDLPWLLEKARLIRSRRPGLPLYVSPQWGNIEYRELAEFIISNRLCLNLSLQVHKIIWPPETRGV